MLDPTQLGIAEKLYEARIRAAQEQRNAAVPIKEAPGVDVLAEAQRLASLGQSQRVTAGAPKCPVCHSPLWLGKCSRGCAPKVPAPAARHTPS